MLVTSTKLYQESREKHFAIPAPNFFDDLSLRTYLKVASDRKLPVIASFAEGHLGLMDIQTAAEIGRYFGERADVPVVLHLDHGMTYEVVIQAIQSGFTSVMIDASSDSFEENIKKTKEIVKVAHACGVVVEAEIGHVGSGENYESHEHSDSIYTDVNEAKKFYEETKVDSLAISIGTAHGNYKGQPKLSFETLDKVKAGVDVPLVLHGGSSTGDENLHRCATSGFSKINIATDLLNAGMTGLNEGNPTDIISASSCISKAMYECLNHYYDVFSTDNYLK